MPAGGFVPGAERNQAAGVFGRGGMIANRGRVRQETAVAFVNLLVQVLTHHGRPIFKSGRILHEEPGQEVAGVGIERGLQPGGRRGSAERLLHVRHVHIIVARGLPAHGLAGDLQEGGIGRFVAKQALQAAQRLAEVGVGGFERLFGPE